MSLINDALKRAASLRKKELSPEGMPLEPAQTSQSNSGNSLKLVLLAILIVGGLGYAGFTWWKGRNPVPAAMAKNGKPAATNAPAAKNAAKTNNNPLARAAAIATSLKTANDQGAQMAESIPSKTAAEGVGNQGKMAAVAVNSQPSSPSAAAGPANSPGPKETGLQAIEFPPMQIQAIYFRSKGSAAVVNGKTIHEGEEVNGVKIAQIARDEIRIEYQGQSKTVSIK